MHCRRRLTTPTAMTGINRCYACVFLPPISWHAWSCQDGGSRTRTTKRVRHKPLPPAAGYTNTKYCCRWQTTLIVIIRVDLYKLASTTRTTLHCIIQDTKLARTNKEREGGSHISANIFPEEEFLSQLYSEI